MSKMIFCVHGEWEDEPDFEEFVHAELPCIVVRGGGSYGHLCGYVGVPPAHPAYPERMKDLNEMMREGLRDPRNENRWILEPRPDAGEHWTDVSYQDLEIHVHGGLTWSEIGDNYAGRREGFKWYGFDCAHSGDYWPPIDPKVYEITQQYPAAHMNETYRNWEYVKNEVRHLAEQLAVMWKPPNYEDWMEDIRKADTVEELVHAPSGETPEE